MLIALLPSEIARLILNYLEEEKYSTTYESFLNECRYLEECKLYLKQGISLPKTIHGKKLSDFLTLERGPDNLVARSTKPTINKSTQTQADPTENEINENRLEIDFSTDSQPSSVVNEPSPAITPPPPSSSPPIESLLPLEKPVRLSPTQEKYKSEGIQCLAELITSNELKVDLTTPTSPVPNIKLAKSPTKSPEIKLYKSPEKKIRLEIKPDIIMLSSDDSDDEMPINFNTSKKRKLLVGRNAEKVPELSVSSLERQLNSIVSDATNHIKLQEEQERLHQQNQMLQNNSFDILNTISKGPPLVDFQVPPVPSQLNQLGHQVIGQIAPMNQITTQLRPINTVTQFNSIGQIAHVGPIGQIGQISQIGQIGQINQIGQISQIGPIGQISLPQQIGIPGFVQPQQVIFVSNPNDLNLNFQAAMPQEQQQIIRIPQLGNLNGVNVATVSDLNSLKKVLSNSLMAPSKQAPILAKALKTCEKMITNISNTAPTSVPANAPNNSSNAVNSHPRIAIKPANGEPVKRVEAKQDLTKEKRSHPRQSSTIKSIFELKNHSIAPTASETSSNNTSNALIVDSDSNSSCSSSLPDVSSTASIQLNASVPAVDTQTKLNESRNNDDHVSDEILGLLGMNVSGAKKETSSKKEESMATDFDLDCIVKKSNSPAKKTPKIEVTSSQNNFQRRKSSRLEAKSNDEIESIFSETVTNKSPNSNSSSSRTLRSRTNSQRRMI